MTKFTNEQLQAVRYFRGLGLQQIEIAELMGVSRQVIGYQLKLLRSTTLKEQQNEQSNGEGVNSLLVGYVSDPPPPAEITKRNSYQDHTCPHYCQMAAYAQIEELSKHQKIAVLLLLLKEVELE